jgi:hypothetical protein
MLAPVGTATLAAAIASGLLWALSPAKPWTAQQWVGGGLVMGGALAASVIVECDHGGDLDDPNSPANQRADMSYGAAAATVLTGLALYASA